MAIAQIHAFRENPAELSARLVHAVRAALVEALRVPANDPTIWLETHSPTVSLLAARHGPGLIHVRVTMFEGRKAETRRELHALLCAQLVDAGIRAEDVLVIVEELPISSWSIGGELQEEARLGFPIRP